MILATLVEWNELLDSVLASVVASIGVTFAFSVGIWGVAQFAELSRHDRPVAAAGAALIGVLALVCVAAALVGAIVVMTGK